jgi:hypothetical protein
MERVVGSFSTQDLFVGKPLFEVFLQPRQTRFFEAFQSKQAFQHPAFEHNSIEASDPALHDSVQGQLAVLEAGSFPQVELSHDSASSQAGLGRTPTNQ